MRSAPRRRSLLPLLLLTLIAGPVLAQAAQARWAPLGPEGGTFTALAVAPTAANTIYAGTWTGLVFRSVDAGGSWSLTGPGLPSGVVTFLVVDPGDAATVYAGLLNPLEEGPGLFRSRDGGRTWAPFGAGLPHANAASFAIDPLDPSTFLLGTYDGVFRSEDGGESWSPSGLDSEPGLSRAVRDLTFDPSSPGRVWAVKMGVEVVRSEDGGRTWTPRRSAGLPAFGAPLSLALDPVSGHLFAGLSLRTFGAPLYRSTDGGETWTATSVQGQRVSELAVSPGQGGPSILHAATGLDVASSWDGGITWSTSFETSEVYALAVSPSSSSPAVYAGTFALGVFKSADAGSTWRSASQGLNAIDADGLAISPSNPSVLYVSSGLRLYRSADGGATWNGRQGFSTLRLPLLQVHPRDPLTVFAAGPEGKVWKVGDGGATWTELSNDSMRCMSTEALVVDPANPDNLYVSGVIEELCALQHVEACTGFRSTDGGESWRCMKGNDHALAIDPRRPSTLYGGGDNRIFKSTNAGRSWMNVTAGLPGGTGGTVSALAVAPGQNGAVFAGTDAGVVRSLDGGATWRVLRNGLPRKAIIPELVIAPSAPSILYAVAARFNAASRTERRWIARSADSGASWSLLSTLGLPAEGFFSLRVHPRRPGTLYAIASRGGLYRLTSGGRTAD